MSRGTFRAFFWKNKRFFFRTLSEEFFLGRVVKTAFYESRGTFWGLKEPEHAFLRIGKFPRKNQSTEGTIFFS